MFLKALIAVVWGGSYQYWCTKYTLYCGFRFRTEQFEFICETVVVVKVKGTHKRRVVHTLTLAVPW